MKEETALDVTDVQFVLVQDCIRSDEFYRDEHFVLLNYRCSAGGAPSAPLAQLLQASDPAPLVYVSMGSSGRADLLPLIARALLERGCRVVMSSAGVDPRQLGVDTARLHVAPYVPAQAVIDHEIGRAHV